MRRRMMVAGGLAAVLGLAGGALLWRQWRRGPALPALPEPVDLAEFEAAHPSVPAPGGPLAVYHLGHSLVGRDMPAMLAQLAGHSYDLQLGWGTPLRAHYEDRVPIPGFHRENGHARFRPARTALESGAYDAVILTEMVEIRDAIRWHASPNYLAKWEAMARRGNPAARLYLYETWHRLDDPEGWLDRIDADLGRYWEGVLLRGAQALGTRGPIHLIPAGQVMAAVVRAAEAGAVPGLVGREALFARLEDGSVDPIHLNDLGHYVVALTHFAVLYHRSPAGMPHDLRRADGSPMDTVAADTAAALQAIVWRTVRATPRTGLAPEAEG